MRPLSQLFGTAPSRGLLEWEKFSSELGALGYSEAGLTKAFGDINAKGGYDYSFGMMPGSPGSQEMGLALQSAERDTVAGASEYLTSRYGDAWRPTYTAAFDSAMRSFGQPGTQYGGTKAMSESMRIGLQAAGVYDEQVSGYLEPRISALKTADEGVIAAEKAKEKAQVQQMVMMAASLATFGYGLAAGVGNVFTQVASGVSAIGSPLTSQLLGKFGGGAPSATGGAAPFAAAEVGAAQPAAAEAAGTQLAPATAPTRTAPAPAATAQQQNQRRARGGRAGTILTSSNAIEGL